MSNACHANRPVPQVVTNNECHYVATELAIGTVRRWSLGYARFPPPQDLDRQGDALLAAGNGPTHIYRDKKSSPQPTQDWSRCCGAARSGDVDRSSHPGSTRDSVAVRDTLNMIYELASL